MMSPDFAYCGMECCRRSYKGSLNIFLGGDGLGNIDLKVWVP